MDGKILLRLRIDRGLTLKELADIANVSYVTISNIENNKVDPFPVTMGRIAKALGLPSDYFIGD